jgi:hypothetical protein
MERLRGIGQFTPPSLADLEQAFDASVNCSGSVINVDLWDIDGLSQCDQCKTHRVERLERMNLTGRVEPRIECHFCAGSDAVM